MYELLDPYQEKAVTFTLEKKTVGLFFEQGTGKTYITGGIVEKLNHSQFSGVIVVPLTNKETSWLKMFQEHLPQINVAMTWDDFRAMAFPKIFLCHYEMLDSDLIKKMKRKQYTLIAYDESQRLKGRGTGQSRRAGQLSPCGEYKIALSGTPVEQSPIDIWGQARFFAPHIFGTRWSTFEGKYVKRTGYMGYERKFRLEMLPEFLSLLRPYSMRVEKTILNLPPIKYYKVGVELKGHQARVYNQLNENLVAELKDTSVITALKVTQLVKLQQVCGGFLIDNEEETHIVGRAKAKRLASLVDKLDKPFVVFCKYRQEIEIVKSILSRKVNSFGVIDGRVKKKRTQIINDFQGGKYDALICQIKTGGVGVDLFRSHTVVFYSLTYSFIDFEQALARVHRRGQTSPVEIYLLYAKETIDEDIYMAILSKKSISNLVLKRLKRE